MYKYSFKQRFLSERFKNCIKSNVNLDIDFSIMLDTKQTKLPNFIDRKLFVREIKRYIYSSGNAKISDKIEFGYNAFYGEVISKYLFGLHRYLEKLYHTWYPCSANFMSLKYIKKCIYYKSLTILV